ncbi:hypothetical protein ACODT3_42840 [Streptomyces sp. 4.24]|uniref:hypothetical protein n=1 Tax=Streptomyces tritrimontium TaxID=3406573 RepID=UPI003BB79642
MPRTAAFAAAYALLRAAADVADHWLQSDVCAQTKGATDAVPVTYTHEKTGAETVFGTNGGIRSCAWHVTTYSAAQGLALLGGARLLGIRLHPAAVVGALAVSGLTHYAADRRVPGGLLHRLAVARQKERFYKLADHGMNGAYVMDQAWHHGWEAVAALIAAAGAEQR